MIFKINQMIDFLEHDASITLNEGDMILTGTPEGILPVNEGDLLEATMHSGGKLVSTMQHRILREHSPLIW